MKTIIFFFIAIICLGFTSKDEEWIFPIVCNISSGKFEEAVSTSEKELQFCDIPVYGRKLIMITLKSTNSDSIAFSSGAAISATNGKYGPGETLVIEVVNGRTTNSGDVGNLRYKADVADDEFKVTH
jgi:hypothetical protein